jgi:hypothetical protein
MQFMATTYGGLLLNNELMKALGSDQRINFTDPSKPDFWRFKTGDGHVLATRGPEEVLRLIGHLTSIPFSTKQELKGASQRQAALDALQKFAQYKIAPGYGLSAEVLFGRDVFGRPLPPELQKAREAIGMHGQLPTPTKPQYTLGEYALGKSPIYIGGGARDYYNQLREQGMPASHALSMMRAALTSFGEFFGFGGYPETPPVDTAKFSRTELRGRLRRLTSSEE